MKDKVNIAVAGNNYIFKRGLTSLINDCNDFTLSCEAENETELFEQLVLQCPGVLILDLSSQSFHAESITQIKLIDPSVQILAFNVPQPGSMVYKLLDLGITSYLMVHCDKDEITEAIYKTAKGERFLCGQIVDTLIHCRKGDKTAECPGFAFCHGVNLSEREMEVIKYIAEGYSNREIAETLFLSVHTVTTHRKNIMGKLGINNTAGIVMYAVRKQLISAN